MYVRQPAIPSKRGRLVCDDEAELRDYGYPLFRGDIGTTLTIDPRKPQRVVADAHGTEQPVFKPLTCVPGVYGEAPFGPALLVTQEPEEKSILAHPQFRWRLRNSRIQRVASVAASSLYSSQ